MQLKLGGRAENPNRLRSEPLVQYSVHTVVVGSKVIPKMLKKFGGEIVLDTKYSNFFVFQYFYIKISVRWDLIMKRTNPGSFVATSDESNLIVIYINKQKKRK